MVLLLLLKPNSPHVLWSSCILSLYLAFSCTNHSLPSKSLESMEEQIQEPGTPSQAGSLEKQCPAEATRRAAVQRTHVGISCQAEKARRLGHNLQPLSQSETSLFLLGVGRSTECQISLLNISEGRTFLFYMHRKGWRKERKGSPTSLSQGFTPRLSRPILVIHLSFATPFPPAFSRVVTSPILSSPFLSKATIPFLDFSSLFYTTQLHLFITVQPSPILLCIHAFHKTTHLGFQSLCCG